MTESGTIVISKSFTTSGSIVTEESVTIFIFAIFSLLIAFIVFIISK